MRFAVVIPARYQSSRFPGKPLVDLCGKPMIVRVWERCVAAVPAADVYVATDDERIRAACVAQGIQVVMTPDDCLTGTDRVYWASRQIDADVLINVQGDEPLLDAGDILAVIEAARRHPGEVINAMCPIAEERDFRSTTVPKVVARPDGRLLYMSRAAIPTDKTHAFRTAQKQVCIYAFSRDSLAAFTSIKAKTPLEQIEDIEILRFLELGYEVRMIAVSDSSVAVDTPEDAERVRTLIKDA